MELLRRRRRLRAAVLTTAAGLVFALAVGGSRASIGRPDFALTAIPTTQAVVAGSSTSYKISLVRRNGFIGNVKVAITSVPPGATATLRLNSAIHSAWILNVSTSLSMRPSCCYAIKVTGTSGAIVHTTSVTLSVVVPDFKLAISPANQLVLDGKQVTYSVSLIPLNGFSGSPTLKVQGLPAGATSIFRPSSLLRTTARLVVVVGAGSAPGTYRVAVTGTYRSLRHTAVVTLVVPAPVITQFPLPTLGTGPTGIVTGPDHALWFTEYGGIAIGRITTAGVVHEFQVTTGSALFSSHICVGPDGALWFTRHAAGWNIGRITTTGQVTQFAAPTYSGLDGITTGPDGNGGRALWFTEWDANQIGEMLPSGNFREFGPVAASPSEIAEGPDGAMWFATLAGEIGRITPAGTLLQYPFPGASYSITAGPDGALWVADYGKSAIDRIATDGQIHEFPLPDGHDPDGITSGPDGALWFTIDGSDEIGRITTQGTIAEYPYTAIAGPGNAGGVFITTGPDGALWFTEANAIGRITPP